MNVKGLKITDIISMPWEELNKLTSSEFKQITNRLVSASNKRIRRLQKARRGTSSFAYQFAEERGRKFSTRGKDLNSLRNEFRASKQFLQMKTSTVKGWKGVRESMEERTGYATNRESDEWSDNTWSKYWKVYRRFEETHGGTFKKGDSDRIQQMLTELMESSDKRRSADYFSEMIEDAYTEMYESDMEDDIDDYFSIE